MEKKKYLIVTSKYKATQLAQAGFKIIDTQLDKHNSEYLVFFFERNEELDKMAKEIGAMK